MGRSPGAVLAALVLSALAAAAPPAARAASPFQWRGIVEGAYGAPWDHAERERVLRWMPAHGFNAYVHAPKDDLYQRTNWRDPYPPDEQADFDAEIRLARSRGVEWIPNLSPAQPLIPSPSAPAGQPSRDLCFSCPDDLRAVVNKLEPFRVAGVRTFMISFDDVTKVMTHPEDAAAYGAGDEAFGRACGDFLTRLDTALKARSRDARVLTVGADYSGTSDTAFLTGLRAKLAPGIGVMWTGTGVPSQDWRAADARAYGQLIGRRPLVWDNWTNDDTAGNALPVGTARIFLGPYRRRAEVAGAVDGFFFNPMNEADLNLLPLATAGEWMAAPQRYSPRRSWLRALAELAPGRSVAARRLRSSLRAWSETSYSTKLDLQDAPTFVRRGDELLRAYAQPLWPGPAAGLDGELALVERAQVRLRALPERAFTVQAAPFLESARQAAEAGRLAVALLGAERPALGIARSANGRFTGSARAPDPARAEALRTQLDQAYTGARTNPRFTYGWRGGTAFEIPPYPVPRNTMDVFIDRVTANDDDWRGRSQQAAQSVALTLDGERVPLRPDGRFSLGRAACGKLLVATDGAGGRTGARLSPCPASARPRSRPQAPAAARYRPRR